MFSYYELKYYLTEEFYEFILIENYNIKQAAGRCFYESFREIDANNFDTLTVYSTILARVARHEKHSLSIFQKELEEIRCLVVREDIFAGISPDEIVAIKEDVNLIELTFASLH